MPGQLIGIRSREAADLDLCVQALATVHRDERISHKLAR